MCLFRISLVELGFKKSLSTNLPVLINRTVADLGNN